MPSAPQSPMTGMMTQTGAEAQPQPTYLYDQTQLQFAQSKILRIISTFRLILFFTTYNENATNRVREGFQKNAKYDSYNNLFLDERIGIVCLILVRLNFSQIFFSFNQAGHGGRPPDFQKSSENYFTSIPSD